MNKHDVVFKWWRLQPKCRGKVFVVQHGISFIRMGEGAWDLSMISSKYGSNSMTLQGFFDDERKVIPLV